MFRLFKHIKRISNDFVRQIEHDLVRNIISKTFPGARIEKISVEEDSSEFELISRNLFNLKKHRNRSPAEQAPPPISGHTLSKITQEGNTKSLTPLQQFIWSHQKFLNIIMDISPPEKVRGMKSLDRSAFNQTVFLPGLKIHNKFINKAMKRLKKYGCHISKVKSVIYLPDEDPDSKTHKVFLMDPTKYITLDSIGDDLTKILTDFEIDKDTFKLYETDIGYENWKIDEVLKAVLPSDGESVAGFSTIGHIAHLNLKDAHLEYKKLIGEVIIDKLTKIRTVINKTNTIDNTFRNFALEILAGEDDTMAETKENGCTFWLDFAKVYWNPRLGTEHLRIVDSILPGQILFDVFAGIGPFAVPTARSRKVKVYANDLNPESYRWLQHNVEKNKVSDHVRTFNLDGRDFIRNIAKHYLVEHKGPEILTCHFTMNLPALAVEFLDAFIGLLSDHPEVPDKVEVNVHCYGFSKHLDPEKDIKERVENILGAVLPEQSRVRYVRNVAPNKEMMCAEFTMPKEVLLRTDNNQNCTEPAEKKLKLSSS